MTAPVGSHSFTTEESAAAEKRHTNIMNDVICSTDGFSHVPNLDIVRLLSESSNQKYSFIKDGKRSQTWHADGGWVFKNGELVGVAECKFQHTRQNACERAFRYLTVEKFREEPRRIFLSCYGPGFENKNGGGSTGPMLDMARNIGMSVHENIDDASFRHRVLEWLESL